MKPTLSFARSLVAGLTVILLSTFPGLGGVGSESAVGGQQALAQRDFEKAYILYRRESSEAQRSRDPQRQADALFYLGLTRQQAATATSDVVQRDAWFKEALAHYRRALRLRPQSGATLNNLAQVYAATGSNELARSTLLRAMELKDAKQPFYTENYADLLLRDGQWREACRFYTQAAWAQPDNVVLQDKIVTVCLKFDRALLITCLWELAQRGQVLQAQRHGFEVLRLDGWEPAQKTELLTLVAFCLSKQRQLPAAFRDSPAALALTSLSEDRIVGEGARALLRLHEGREFQPKAYQWWQPKPARANAPLARMLPEDAFLALVRVLAESCVAAGQTTMAEAYLRLAVNLIPHSPDPEALTALANLYAGSHQLDELALLMKQHEDDLLNAKMEAYRAAQYDKIYQFHTALGVIYAHLNRWGDSHTVTSAIFQLEHARTIAARSGDAVGKPPVRVEPAVIHLLARGYDSVHAPEKSFALRTDMAAEYLKANDSKAARAVLAPLAHKTIPTQVDETRKNQYQQLKLQVEKSGARPQTGALPNTKVSVRVSTRARPMAGNVSMELAPAEQRALEDSLNQFLRRQTATEKTTNPAPRKSFTVLPANALPKDVKQVDFDGQQGKVVIEKNSKLVEVPFSVDPTASPKNPARVRTNQRYVKP